MKACSAEGCDRNWIAKGLCLKHYKKMRKYGDPLFQKIAPRGSGSINGLGYRQVYVDGKLVGEHRVIMSKHLGRPLEHHEQVHHIDGDRSNNAIENLEVLLLGEHQARHCKSFRNETHKQCARCDNVFERRMFYPRKATRESQFMDPHYSMCKKCHNFVSNHSRRKK